jgi:hypothetical protein
MGLRLEGITGDSRRAAAAVLEVLAGVCSPDEAAKSLGMSLPAYYKLEVRAVQGLIEGCRRPERGPRVSTDDRFEKLTRHCQHLQQELQRYQALVRNAQRAAGLGSSPTVEKTDIRGRRKRRPSVRALKAVEMLRSPSVAEESASPVSPPPSTPT